MSNVYGYSSSTSKSENEAPLNEIETWYWSKQWSYLIFLELAPAEILLFQRDGGSSVLTL